jgi:hypothetical protein
MKIPSVAPSFARPVPTSSGVSTTKTPSPARSVGPAVVVSLSAEARAMLAGGPWGSVQPDAGGPWGVSQPSAVGPAEVLPADQFGPIGAGKKVQAGPMGF